MYLKKLWKVADFALLAAKVFLFVCLAVKADNKPDVTRLQFILGAVNVVASYVERERRVKEEVKVLPKGKQ